MRETTNRVLATLHEKDTDAGERTNSEYEEIEAISADRERSSRAYMNGHRRSDSSNDYNQRALRERTNRRVLEIQEIQTEDAKRGRSNDD